MAGVRRMATRHGNLIPDYRYVPFDHLLGDLSSDAPLPGGGSAAAVAASIAASLAGKTARRSQRYRDDALQLATHVDEARDRLVALISVDAESYGQALEARRLGRDAEVATAAAAAPPAAIAEQAATVAHVAAEVTERGNPHVRGDALVALRLAVAASVAAAELAVTDDPKGRSAERARTAVISAHDAAERVSATAA